MRIYCSKQGQPRSKLRRVPTVSGSKVKKTHSFLIPRGILLPGTPVNHKGGISFVSQWTHSPLRGQSWGLNQQPSPPSFAVLGPAPPSQRHLQKNQKPVPSRSCSLPQTGKPAHSPGIRSNHRPKKAKFILTSNDAFVLNFRRTVSLQTCSFPAKRRKGRRSILASALGILR